MKKYFGCFTKNIILLPPYFSLIISYLLVQSDPFYVIFSTSFLLHLWLLGNILEMFYLQFPKILVLAFLRPL